MKRAFSLGLLAIAAVASSQTIQTAHKYKVGDVDAYHMTMKMEGTMTMAISMDTTQKVLAVYDNGEADVETTVSDMTMDMMGQNRKLPAQPAVKSRITKYGTPVEGSAAGAAAGRRGAMGMDFSKYMRQLPQGEMKVGQTLPIDAVDATNPKVHIKGKTTLESVTGGVGKLVTTMDVALDGATTPMHLDFVTLVEAATAKTKHVEGKITHLEGAPGVPKGLPIESVTIVMDRKE